jgi:hypothetical protein
MSRTIRPNVTEADQVRIETAYDHLGTAMSYLRDARASKAADYVGRCRKSTWGALEHCKRALWKQLDRQGKL